MITSQVAGHPVRVTLLWWLALAVGGALMLVRLLPALATALPPTGDFALAAHRAVLARGLTRLLVAQLVLPPPYLVLGAAALSLAAAPVLGLSGARPRAVWAVAATGLLPFLAHRLGQLVTVWALAPESLATPGAVMQAAHQFATGPLPLLASTVGLPSPAWQRVLEHVTLVDLAAVLLWAHGLARTEGSPLRLWHAALAAATLAAGVAATHLLAPLVLPLVLGG